MSQARPLMKRKISRGLAERGKGGELARQGATLLLILK